MVPLILFGLVVIISCFAHAQTNSTPSAPANTTQPGNKIDPCGFSNNESYKLLLSVFFGMIGMLTAILSILFNKSSFKAIKEYSSWSTLWVPMQYHILIMIIFVIIIFITNLIRFHLGQACPPNFAMSIFMIVFAALYTGMRLLYLLFRPW